MKNYIWCHSRWNYLVKDDWPVAQLLKKIYDIAVLLFSTLQIQGCHCYIPFDTCFMYKDLNSASGKPLPHPPCKNFVSTLDMKLVT